MDNTRKEAEEKPSWYSETDGKGFIQKAYMVGSLYLCSNDKEQKL
ncbi:hypothetical protein PORCRE_1562 [Porphyromonas crevioricanis JCM 15906]|uniref:Uncharacterized protein n=1 Tax=Porphyromonas crevioricanis JCM 15906 TaxID=1305617 RepID=T1CRY4_9PORP|nr:hypothetical protein PORCRE_1562 [Porphyromonas crevioricanis JCM 15906]GAD07999.1 hypothetical protein PORCAN_1629 [Porphyromonas crevioricanis JCM 13913]